MKKVTLVVLLSSVFVQNSAMAMQEEEQGTVFRSARAFNSKVVEQEDSLETYKRTVKKLERLVNEVDSPSDIHRIRRTAKLALSLQPKHLKGNPKLSLDLYARFGTGTCLKSFLNMSNTVLLMVRHREPDAKIHSAILATLIMAPRNIKECDFKVLRPAFYKR